MKNIFSLLFILCSHLVFAQSDTSSFSKIDRSKIILPSKNDDIFYEKVVSCDSVTKDDMYTAARTWFSSMFQSAKSVLDMDDRNSGKLIGKGNLLYTSTQKIFGERRAGFTIDITVKDGKYRVQLYDIKDLTDDGYGQLNDFNVENLHIDKKQKYRTKFKNAALSGFNTAVTNLLASLNEAMQGSKKDSF